MDAYLAQLPVELFTRERLRSLLEQVEKEWHKTASESGADAIHDLRVALRRFGEALRLMKDLLPKRGCKQVRAERRQIMQLAGRTRDVDIARETFVYSDISIPAELDHFLANERACAEAAVRAVLAVGLTTDFSKRWDRTLALSEGAIPQLVDDINRAATVRERSAIVSKLPAPSETTDEGWHSGESAAVNAMRVLPRLLEDYCQRGQELAVDGVKVARLHELRLRGKHVRYALELFRPIYGQRMGDLLARLKESQTDLGEISDCTATIVWLKEKKLVGTPEGQHLRSYLEHRAEKGAAQFLNFWRDHWGLPAFRDRWIRYLAVYAGRTPPPRPTSRDDSSPPAEGGLEPAPSFSVAEAASVSQP